MMFYCSNCGAYFDEKELVDVAYDRGKKHDAVCPECFAELVNSLQELSPEEETAIRREWDADDLYDRMMEDL